MLTVVLTVVQTVVLVRADVCCAETRQNEVHPTAAAAVDLLYLSLVVSPLVVEV